MGIHQNGTTALELKKITLGGNNYEIGLEHGRLLKPHIHRQIQIYKSMFAHTSNLHWVAVTAIAKQYEATIRTRTPHLHDEMRGIAEGAGVGLLDIVSLNCRSEIALGEFSDGCTSLVWKVDDVMYLAQNWDWVRAVKENLVLMTIQQEGKPEIKMMTEAGIVGKIGYNTASVGVCLNAIRAHPTDSGKLPIHVAIRICLEATSASDAKNTLEQLGGVASSQHILVADLAEAMAMELSPNGNVYLPLNQDNLVVHTNHFIENKLVDEPPWLTGSPVRLKRAYELVAKLDKKGAITSKLRDEVFTDVFGSPQSICCQEDMERHHTVRSMTLFNIVMVFEQGKEPRAEMVYGRPGSGDEGSVVTF